MVETRPFDVQDYLKSPADRAAYLAAILDDGDPTLIAAGLGDIIRALGVKAFARQTALSQEVIAKELVAGGNPTLETITKVAKALGLRLAVTPIDTAK